jgi:hypothetical protein
VLSSSRVLRVLAWLRFRSVLVSSFGWKRFRTVRSSGADSPRVPSGQSACSPRMVRFSGFATGGSVSLNGQSAAQGRTVRGTGADNPRQQAEQSAWPVWIVRPSWPDGPPEPGCFVSWFDSSPLLSCFRMCFKESFLRLEVDPYPRCLGDWCVIRSIARV